MSTETTTVRVNFSKPFPVFPLHSTVLMPHGIAPLHIFEPRYRQMVSDALDGAGQIAMAVFDGRDWLEQYHGRPPVRPAVCVGQIVQHHRLPDGRYNIVLQGICRAKIVAETPAEENRLYRTAHLEPVGLSRVDEGALEPARDRVAKMLTTGPLRDLRDAAAYAEHLKADAVPTSTLLELLSQSVFADSETRYRLLAAGDPAERANIVTTELRGLESLLRRAAPQRQLAAPKGCCWN